MEMLNLRLGEGCDKQKTQALPAKAQKNLGASPNSLKAASPFVPRMAITPGTGSTGCGCSGPSRLLDTPLPGSAAS